jgi:hypothetical protein
MRAAPGLLALLIGAGLIGGPWWSSTLPESDYPLVIVLGIVFAAIGIPGEGFQAASSSTKPRFT